MSQEPKPKLRWYQLSLQEMFVLTAMISIPLLWLGGIVRNAHEQQQAAKALQKMGAIVHYDYEYELGKFVPNARPRGPRWLQNWLGCDIFGNIIEVNFGPAPTVIDNSLTHLRCLHGLENLFLCKVSLVTDAGLQQLDGLSRLRKLTIVGPAITDAGLHHIHKLTKLEYFDLVETHVTENGCQDFQKSHPEVKVRRFSTSQSYF